MLMNMNGQIEYLDQYFIYVTKSIARLTALDYHFSRKKANN